MSNTPSSRETRLRCLLVAGGLVQGTEYYIVTKNGLRRIREKLLNPETRDEAMITLRQVLRMKETLFWRAESPGGCAAVISLSGGLFRQV
jgi:hypothetical protein